jgi:hypothetical protein
MIKQKRGMPFSGIDSPMEQLGPLPWEVATRGARSKMKIFVRIQESARINFGSNFDGHR